MQTMTVTPDLVLEEFLNSLSRDAHRSDTSRERAWSLVHPDLQLALAQDYVGSLADNTLEVKIHGRAKTIERHVDGSGTYWDAFVERIILRWNLLARSWRVGEDRPIDEGVMLFTAVDIVSGMSVEICMRETDQGWRVASFDSDRLPIPGSPPDLAGTAPVGHSDFRFKQFSK